MNDLAEKTIIQQQARLGTLLCPDIGSMWTIGDRTWTVGALRWDGTEHIVMAECGGDVALYPLAVWLDIAEP